MEEKKILLIAYNPLNIVGGIETYNNALVDVLKKYFPDVKIHIAIVSLENAHKRIPIDDITYDIIPSVISDEKNIIWRFFTHNKKIKLVDDFIKELCDKNDFNIIINSTYLYLSSISEKNNYFLIQHNDASRYVKNLFQKNNFWKNFFKNFVMRLFFHERLLITKASNIVVYDSNNYDFFKKYTAANLVIISLFSKQTKEITENEILERKNIIYSGRIDVDQKRVDKLIKINEKLHLIDFYGLPSSNGQPSLNELNEKGWYKGYFEKNSDVLNLLTMYKFLILYSDYEGFGFSLVEALSCGIPIIVRNTFLSASFLCNKKTGLLLSRHSNLKKDIKLIQDFYNMDDKQYLEYFNNCKNFYNENFTLNIFENKWIDIFKKYL